MLERLFWNTHSWLQLKFGACPLYPVAGRKSETEPQATEVCLQCDLCRSSAAAFKTQVLKTLAELQEHVKYVA